MTEKSLAQLFASCIYKGLDGRPVLRIMDIGSTGEAYPLTGSHASSIKGLFEMTSEGMALRVNAT